MLGKGPEGLKLPRVCALGLAGQGCRGEKCLAGLDPWEVARKGDTERRL